MEVLGKRLSWLRGKQRYSQKDIATMIGMTPSGYQKIELGQRDPKLDVLIKFCDIFNVSSDFLLGRENDVYELSNLHFGIEKVKEKIVENKLRLEEMYYDVTRLREELIERAQKEGFTSERTMYISHKLDRRMREIEVMQTMKESLTEEFKVKIFNYVKFLLDIPNANISNDPLLESYLPMVINIQLTLFNEYSLMLYGQEIGYLGELISCNTEDEAVKLSDDILKRING